MQNLKTCHSVGHDVKNVMDGRVFVCQRYKTLCEGFEKQGVVWCSWKSNEHVGDGLLGKTDVDMLFLPQDRARVGAIMRENGFVLFKAPFYRAYPGVLDFVALDPENGGVLHAHAHFLLTLGEENLKSFILPWNDGILNARRRAEGAAGDAFVYVSAPEDELVLLFVRAALKLRRFGTPAWRKRGFRDELAWLLERVAPENVLARAEVFLSDAQAVACMRSLLAHGVTERSLRALRARVFALAAVNGWRRMGGVEAFLRRKINAGLARIVRNLGKAGLCPDGIVQRRTLEGQGAIIAIMGPDGAGKSTVSGRLISEWSGKVDVVSLYFGNGDSRMTFNRIIIKGASFIWRILKKTKKKSPTKKEKITLSKSAPLKAVLGVWHKRSVMKRARALRKRGYIVVCDRWPQNAVSGMNDGPLLSALKDSPNPFLRRLALWEEKAFEEICVLCAPDIAFVLLPSLAVAVSRKAEHIGMEEIIRRKLEGFRALRFPGTTEKHEIDADQPLFDVFAHVRHAIAQRLSANTAVGSPDFYECLGLPGAGKTTICQVVQAKDLVRSGCDIFFVYSKTTTDRLVGNAVLFAWSVMGAPLLYARLFLLVVRGGIPWNAKALRHIGRLPLHMLKIRRAQTKPVLFDQLSLQNVWSALVSSGVKRASPALLAPVLSGLYAGLTPLIVYFSVTPEEAARRVCARKDGRSRFDGLSEKDVLEELRAVSILMEDIAKAAAFAGMNVVHIDANRPESQVTQDMIAVVKT